MIMPDIAVDEDGDVVVIEPISNSRGRAVEIIVITLLISGVVIVMSIAGILVALSVAALRWALSV